MNEFDYIEKYFKPLTNDVARDLSDDAAVFKQRSKYDLVISTDTLAEGIHFFGHENPRDIAKKSLRVNLSDMAAMGAKPIFYNLSISIPKNKVKYFIPKFSKGLEEDQKLFGLKLIGGDLTSSLQNINITITIFGETLNKKSISRSGAKSGDLLFVSGILGLSKIGLDNFKSTLKGFSLAKKKYLFPQPRVNLGISLKKIANSMIDVSDGLVQDAAHLAKSSSLSIVIDVEKIPLPISIDLKKDILLDAALFGGDDYELLFSCKPTHEKSLKKLSLEHNINLTCIGFFQRYKKQNIIFQNRYQYYKNKSYLHF
ncbi:thiamine-phosphate kinase [Alphaproteobacteria bacterium]|nr:thiamine-phosphate kinase [Alphaproteobacteria bacterium]